MKVSLKWLSEYTAVPEDLKAFCDRLDLTGTGVEGVEKTGEAFEGVVVGHVLTKRVPQRTEMPSGHFRRARTV